MKVLRPSASTTVEQVRGIAGKVTATDAGRAGLPHLQPRAAGPAPGGAAEVAAETPDLVVVVGADETSAPVWAAADNLIELSRVDRGGLRLWCDDVSAPFHTAEEQAAAAPVLRVAAVAARSRSGSRR